MLVGPVSFAIYLALKKSLQRIIVAFSEGIVGVALLHANVIKPRLGQTFRSESYVKEIQVR